MILSELIPFLNQLKAQPKKSLSQNFLVDPPTVQKILALAEVHSTDFILEVGPGPGALTAALLEKGARVLAVEMDPLFARALNRFPPEKLTVVKADFLTFSLDPLPENFKVVANLPYHITTPILEKIFAAPFSSITVMVQKEVADRMVAEAGSKTFGSLSLFVQYYSQLHSHFSVPANCFYPRPEVDSTVIRLDKKPPPSYPAVPFFSLVRKAFQQRRKMLTSTLPFLKEEIKKALIAIGSRPDARPEALNLEKWLQLAHILQPQ